MTVLLVIIALLVAVVGALTLTQATMGVGLIAIACFIGILARLAQASIYHRAMRGP